MLHTVNKHHLAVRGAPVSRINLGVLCLELIYCMFVYGGSAVACFHFPDITLFQDVSTSDLKLGLNFGLIAVLVKYQPKLPLIYTPRK